MTCKELDGFLTRNLQQQQARKDSQSNKESMRLTHRDTLQLAEERLLQAGISKKARERLLSLSALTDFNDYTSNIENYIGTVSVPVGMAGPLHIHGSFAYGDYYVPLATTEAALVASYNRGLTVIKACGGATSIVVNHSVRRTPLFKFNSLIEATQFTLWVQKNLEQLKQAAEETTRHGKLLSIDWQIESNLVLLIFSFSTGNASGQNMVTLATNAAYQYILQYCPIKSTYHFLEGNSSGDKKASSVSLASVRGYKVCAEIVLPRKIVQKYLRVEPEVMFEYWKCSTSMGMLMMSFDNQGHFANALAALFLACGQDAACVAEAAIGITKLEIINKEDLYVSVTMPNIIVGTIGGGTQLPDQKACLEVLGLKNKEHSAAEFAEIIAGTCLAGEISLISAICGNYFSRSHHVLARIRKKKYETV